MGFQWIGRPGTRATNSVDNFKARPEFAILPHARKQLFGFHRKSRSRLKGTRRPLSAATCSADISCEQSDTCTLPADSRATDNSGERDNKYRANSHQAPRTRIRTRATTTRGRSYIETGRLSIKEPAHVDSTSSELLLVVLMFAFVEIAIDERDEEANRKLASERASNRRPPF